MTSESDNCHSVCTLWLVRWACRSGTKDFCSALAAQVGPEKNIFILTIHDFHSFAPIAKPACRLPRWVACLLVFAPVLDEE
jgi:hypothetical protein